MASAQERYRARLSAMRDRRGPARPAPGSTSTIQDGARKGPDAAARAIAAQLGVDDPTVTEKMAAALRSGQPERATEIATAAVLGGTPDGVGQTGAAGDVGATDSSDDEEAPPPPPPSVRERGSCSEETANTVEYVPRCTQAGGRRVQRRRKAGKKGKSAKNGKAGKTQKARRDRS